MSRDTCDECIPMCSDCKMAFEACGGKLGPWASLRELAGEVLAGTAEPGYGKRLARGILALDGDMAEYPEDLREWVATGEGNYLKHIGRQSF
jgi:hypothetical protein